MRWHKIVFATNTKDYSMILMMISLDFYLLSKEEGVPISTCVLCLPQHCSLLNVVVAAYDNEIVVLCVLPTNNGWKRNFFTTLHSFILCCIEFVIYADDPPAPTTKRVFFVMACHCSRSEISSTKALYGFIMAKKWRQPGSHNIL